MGTKKSTDTNRPTAALDELLALLELERLEENLFRGLSPDEDQQRVFGGQVAAQALIAAGRTIEDQKMFILYIHIFCAPAILMFPSSTKSIAFVMAVRSLLVE